MSKLTKKEKDFQDEIEKSDDKCEEDSIIMSLKKKYKLKKVYKISLEGKDGYLKEPDLDTINTAMPLLADKNFMGAGSVILNSCWLEGNEDLLTDQELLPSLYMNVISLITMKSVDIVKK